MLDLHLCKRILSIAWNRHSSPFSRLYLPGWTFKGVTLFIHMEIKVVEQRVTLSCWRFTGTLWPHLTCTAVRTKNSCTKKGATTSHSTFPVSLKEAWILTQVRCFLGDTHSLFSQSAGSLNKVTIPCPNTSSLDVSICHVVCSISLGPVTVLPHLV